MKDLNLNLEVASLSELFLLDPLDEQSLPKAIKVAEAEFIQLHPSVLEQKIRDQEKEKTVMSNKMSLGQKLKMGIIQQAIQKKLKIVGTELFEQEKLRKDLTGE